MFSLYRISDSYSAFHPLTLLSLSQLSQYLRHTQHAQRAPFPAPLGYSQSQRTLIPLQLPLGVLCNYQIQLCLLYRFFFFPIFSSPLLPSSCSLTLLDVRDNSGMGSLMTIFRKQSDCSEFMSDILPTLVPGPGPRTLFENGALLRQVLLQQLVNGAAFLYVQVDPCKTRGTTYSLFLRIQVYAS